MEKTQSSWLWDGKMIDCNGRVSVFRINEPDKSGNSDFILQLSERNGMPTEFKGQVKLSYDDEKNMQLEFHSGKENGNENFSWNAKLKSSSAGIYAKNSVFGTYQSPNEEAILSNGVMVMWQFA